MKKWFITTGIVVLVLGLGIWSWYHKSSKVQTAPIVTVTKGTIIEKAQAIGYIKPLHSNKVKSSVDGIVSKLFHDEGDFVTKGTPLLEIKPTPQPSVYATVYEALIEGIANERAAYKHLTRLERGVKMGLYSKSYADYITAKQTYAVAKAKRILAQQKLALLDKGKTIVGKKVVANIVPSPITGYVLSKNVDVGDPVISLSSTQSATTLFTMANMKDMMFEGSVDELDAAKIHLHIPATITIGAAPKQKITGKLDKIALQSDQQNQVEGGAKVDSNLPFNVSFQVKITNFKIPTDFVLRSGYSATADIVLKTVKNVPILPERVLHFDQNKTYVLLPPAEKDQKPVKRYVKIGLSDGVNAEIESGLKIGEKVLDQPDIPVND